MDSQEQKKIDHLERIINNLNQHWHSIQLLLGYVSKPLLIDDIGLRTSIIEIQNGMTNILDSLGKTIEQIQTLDISQTYGEIKFIGKRLDSIEKTLTDMKEKGVKKEVELSFTCEGYELVKKQKNHDPGELVQNLFDPIDKLLKTLPKREVFVLTHLYGLYGEKKKSQKEIGELLTIHRERVGAIHQKAIRKCRHSSRLEFVKAMPPNSLRRKILGE